MARVATFGALLIAHRRRTDPAAHPRRRDDRGPVSPLVRGQPRDRRPSDAAKHVVVVGASFIGLEVAAALRTRGLAVTVVAPESRPLVRVMGEELGAFVQILHEAHGVALHLGETVDSISGRNMALSGGANSTPTSWSSAPVSGRQSASPSVQACSRPRDRGR